MLEIDGSFGEGGGQVLRTATALSLFFKSPCYIFNIRKNRPNPGLANQHLIYLEALTKLSQGKVEGNFISSKEIKFFPGDGWEQRLDLKISTAASITLILQGVLLAALFAPKKTEIKFQGGATDTFFSPPIDYFRFVFLRFLEVILKSIFKKEINPIEIEIIKRGFYPKGGAEVEVKIYPLSFLSKKEKTTLPKERGEIKKVFIISGASKTLKERKVAERQISGIHQTPIFYKKLKLPVETKIEYYPTISPGSQMTIIGEFENTVLGASNLGKLKKSAEEVGREAGMEFLREVRSEGLVDRYLADQILPYLALVSKKVEFSTSEITKHTRTNIWVIEKFLKGKFRMEKNTIKWED